MHKTYASEIDVLIIAPAAEKTPNWLQRVHIISFSSKISVLPGPNAGDWISISGEASTEEYVLPDLPLSFSRRRDADLASLSSVKGWPKLKITLSRITATEQDQASMKVFLDDAIILDRHDGLPFATMYQRLHNNLGVAWLPQPIFNQVAWVELIVTHWAQSDRERFPDFGDWTKSQEWMLPSEEKLVSRINALENERREVIARIDQEVGSLTLELSQATLAANKGRRRLLTAQGDELVEEVAAVFREMGFEVQLMDEVLDANLPKREDLRLREVSKDGDTWEAIVEIRGYKRSAGTTADLSRLARFAELYLKEQGRLPDKRLYVVNGQLELLPPHRQRAFLKSGWGAKEQIEGMIGMGIVVALGLRGIGVVISQQ